MNKALIVIFILILGVTPVFSQLQGVLTEVTGKVEIKVPGGDWTSAEEGTSIAAGTMISTGFGAQAVLDLDGSTLLVRPLTRMRLDELVEKEGTVNTELFLRVGKVRAEVKSTAGLKQNFTLRSPVSTAAVRGTSFEYDGPTIVVFTNAVLFTNILNQGRTVRAGEHIRLGRYRPPDRGESGREKGAGVNPSTLFERYVVDSSKPSTAPVTITLIW